MGEVRTEEVCEGCGEMTLVVVDEGAEIRLDCECGSLAALV